MTLQAFLQYLADGLFLVIFAMVVSKAVRFRRKTLVHAAMLFGDAAVVVLISLLVDVLPSPPSPSFALVTGVLLLALPYPLLQLLDDAVGLSPWLLRLCEVSMGLSIAGLVLLPVPRPGWLTALQIAYFVGATYSSAVAFGRGALVSRGVTRRRMQAVAVGSFFLAADILAAGLLLALPQFTSGLMLVTAVCPIVSGVGYYLGFSPPRWLQRAWQEPELRRFLAKAASLPRLPNTDAIVRELEQGARESFGTPMAAIGLWREDEGILQFEHHPIGRKERTAGDSTDEPYDYDIVRLRPGEGVTGKAFALQRPVSSFDLRRDHGDVATLYQAMGIQCVLAAPISAGNQRLGVLGVFGLRQMVFAEDDLSLTSLVADQAAVILESRALIDEATRVQAREKAAEMEMDFLSAAAHEFRTPLTTLLGAGQLLQRRANTSPELAPHLDDINAIVRQAQRMRNIVSELLDASRINQGNLLADMAEVDLVALAHEVCDQHNGGQVRCSVVSDADVVACCDAGRMMQVLENLVQNSVKYSPDGGDIEVRLWSDTVNAHIAVRDHGIGIAAEDLPFIFSRFSRGRNISHRKFVGLGLGLFIVRGIVEEHGGSVAVTSRIGEGTTMQVTIPLTPAVVQPQIALSVQA